jgi:hypothetical protein|tara:strand:+ start:267 stop:626 length:360 start_codon:yes stop_codon:yes gene_type:complete
MKEKAVFIGDLHFEHKMWKRGLNFCKDELSFLKTRLEEVVLFHENEMNMMREVEHFQNQFTHDINQKEHELAEFAKDHSVTIDHIHLDDHAGIKNNMESFAKNYNIMKQEFRQFLAMWK